jgi:uncharacterized protein (TIGR00369 family)
MQIWQVKPELEIINLRGRNTMSEHLGIEFIRYGDDFITARMPISERNRQPIGIMHGGASCVLAETVGSTAAQFCVDMSVSYCVGLDINTNHIRAIREGWVIATAKPFHLGKTTQVWSIEIHDEAEHLISITRLTMAVLARKK